MKRILIGVIAALVLLYPAMVWLVGFSIEKRFVEASTQMSGGTPYLTVVENRYRRGWYSSQHDMTLELKLPSAPLRITAHSVIHHGPICGMTCFGLARAETRFAFSDQANSALANAFGAAGAFGIESRLGFFGGGSSKISAPAVKDIALADGAHLTWGGAAGTFRYGRHYDSYGMHVTLPTVGYTGADGARMEAAAAVFDARSERALRSLYLGDSSFSVGRVAFARAGGAASFSMSDVHSESQGTADNGFMTLSSKTGIGAMAAPVALSAVHFDIAFRHLEMESMERLTAAMREANVDPASAPAERSAKMLAVFKQQGVPLLLHQPEIAIDRVSVATADGQALLTGWVRLSGVAAADFAAGADPAAVIQKLDVELDLTFDEAMLKNVPGAGADAGARVQMLADQGLLTRQTAKSARKILFHRGQTTFNGKLFRPPRRLRPLHPPWRRRDDHAHGVLPQGVLPYPICHVRLRACSYGWSVWKTTCFKSRAAWGRHGARPYAGCAIPRP